MVVIKQFIDRESEIRTLEREYAKETATLVIVYGRRRVGKTTLLSEFTKNKKTIYFLATQESEAVNRNLFREKAAEALGNELLLSAVVDKWDAIFKAIVSESVHEKMVVVIDEFQYLGKTNSAFPSVVQKIWDDILKQSNMMLILCGSLISMMVSQTLAYGSPLYGRRTAQIRLKQIPFRHYREFCGDLPFREQVERYAVTGVCPNILNRFLIAVIFIRGLRSTFLMRRDICMRNHIFCCNRRYRNLGVIFRCSVPLRSGTASLPIWHLQSA